MESLHALMWREKLLLTADRQSQVYRYAQMAFLAFVLSTVMVRGRVSNSDDLAVCCNSASVLLQVCCICAVTLRCAAPLLRLCCAPGVTWLACVTHMPALKSPFFHAALLAGKLVVLHL